VTSTLLITETTPIVAINCEPVTPHTHAFKAVVVGDSRQRRESVAISGVPCGGCLRGGLAWRLAVEWARSARCFSGGALSNSRIQSAMEVFTAVCINDGQ
jgi:hypothetical protein